MVVPNPQIFLPSLNGEGKLQTVALCSLSRACHKCRNEQNVVISEPCPPVLPSATPAPLAVGENHLHAAGVEGTCRSYQCLSADISSIVFCSQLYTQAQSPFLPSWAGLGLLPLLWACWKIYCVCWRPDLCGFRLRGLVSKPGSLKKNK